MDVSVFRYGFLAMNTRCELQIFSTSQHVGESLATRIRCEVERLSQRYNFHTSDSWLNLVINQRKNDVVEVDEECAQILQFVRTHSLLTSDAFDITVGTCARQLQRARTVTDAASIRARLLPYIGSHQWELQGNRLRFARPATQFDLGGVIKEYAVDWTVRTLREAGIKQAIVNYGGDVYVLGHDLGASATITVPNPANPHFGIFELGLNDMAVTTSAHYFQQRQLALGKVKDKQRRSTMLSHIVCKSSIDYVSPAASQRAQPVRRKYLSVSVISPSALLSGIYSTALMADSCVSLPDTCTGFLVDQELQLHVQEDDSVKPYERL